MVAEYLANCSELSPISDNLDESRDRFKNDLMKSFDLPCFSSNTSSNNMSINSDEYLGLNSNKFKFKTASNSKLNSQMSSP